jgi:hypothetical protein
MLTIFALPKPFQGQIDIIQRNAIGSWLMMRPPCQITLFGDEKGTADAAKEFGVLHQKEVVKNDFGTPLLSDLFKKAQRLAENDMMCYVNSDIILLNEFMLAVQRLRQHAKDFLAIGQCWNLDLGNPVDFERSDWDQHLRSLVKQEGEARGPWAIDYFVFPRGFYKQIPPFAVGRAYFDNWLIWKAIAQKAQVVDLTSFVTVIHQNHDYAHVEGGQQWVYRGPEAILNTNLGGGISRRYCILDATHYLDPSGLRRNFFHKLNWSMLKIWKKRIWYLIFDSTRPLRHSLGIRSDIFQKFKSFLLRKRRTIDSSEKNRNSFYID